LNLEDGESINASSRIPPPPGRTEGANFSTIATYTDSNSTGDVPFDYGDLITNADQGIYLIWSAVNRPYFDSWRRQDANGNVTTGGTGSVTTTYAARITPVANGQLGIDVPLPWLSSNQASKRIDLQLQLQNGDFIAFIDYGSAIMALNPTTGDLHWSKPAAQYSATPLHALANGGMVYRETQSVTQLVTLNAGGNELTRVADDGIVYSWFGAYKKGSTLSVAIGPSPLASDYAAVSGGNIAPNGQSIVPCDVQIGGTTLRYGPKTPCPFQQDAHGALIVTTSPDFVLNRTSDCFDGLHRHSTYAMTPKGNAVVPSPVNIVEHHTVFYVTSDNLGTSSSGGLTYFTDEIGPSFDWPIGQITRTERIFTVDLQGQRFVVPVHTEADYAVESIWWFHNVNPKTQVFVNGTLAPFTVGCR
jgi:hypothetical protein